MPGIGTQRHDRSRVPDTSYMQQNRRIRNNPSRNIDSAPKPPPQGVEQTAKSPPQLQQETCLKFPQSGEISFYSNSDLTLKAILGEGDNKEKPVALHVASTALCIASPVFRAMLAQDKYLEGAGLHSSRKLGQSYILQLPEDDAESLAILCHIIHLNHHKVPRSMTVERLARLCVVLDKYVCTLAAASWIDFWLAHMPQNTPEPTPRDLKADGSFTDLMWLYIALVVGDKQRFNFYSSRYIMNAPDYEAMSPIHREWFERLPGRMQDDLLNVSQAGFESVASLVDAFCNGSMGTSGTNCQSAHAKQVKDSSAPFAVSSVEMISPQECDARTAGKLLQDLYNAGLSSSPLSFDLMTNTMDTESVPVWLGSVGKFIDAVEGIVKGLGARRNITPHHQSCGKGMILQAKLRELKLKMWQSGLSLFEYRGAYQQHML
ncbi:hypothetical protein DFH27DRAFT_107042 [Peziza echinospora]|nr:hypothetical protein DFH27DRAFT_107042 [Peziza echinospora]